MKKLLVVLIFILLPSTLLAANAINTTDNTNTNTVNLIGPVQVPGEQELSYRTAPYLPAIPFMDHPGYTGGGPTKGWNSQEGTALPFILNSNPDKQWTITYEFSWSSPKSKVDKVAEKEYPAQESVKVFNGDKNLKDIKYKTIASIVTYGDELTTMACFSEAIYQTMQVGGNAFVLLTAGSTQGVWSRTIGIGGSSAGNFGMGGREAYSAGTAIGYSSNTGRPVFQTFVQGVAILIE